MASKFGMINYLMMNEKNNACKILMKPISWK